MLLRPSIHTFKSNNDTSMKKVVFTVSAPAPIGPYSQAVSANGMIYLSGQIAIDPGTGNLANTKDIGEETKWVMEHIKTILESAGSSMNKVVKCGIFLKDMNDFAEVNKVYGSYFQQDPPARETVQVSRLPKDVNVEISAIALAE
jgi:2-iminobutanoate/2-iminopropanoate deaminase